MKTNTRGLDLNEAKDMGAALQASHLMSTQLLDNAPTASARPSSKTMQSSVALVSGDAKQTLFNEGTVVPAHFELKGAVEQADGAFKLEVDGKEVGELVFKADMVGKAEEISAVIDVDDSGKIAVEVKQTRTGIILTSLTI